MKKLILSLTSVFVTLTSFSQSFELEVSDFVHFNSGKVSKLSEILKSENHVSSISTSNSKNIYHVDLDNMTIERSLYGQLRTSQVIYSKKEVNGVLYLTCSDTENSTGKKITSTVVIDKDDKDKNLPLILIYFTSTVTGTTNGYISK
jgi:hypothetical protein